MALKKISKVKPQALDWLRRGDHDTNELSGPAGPGSSEKDHDWEVNFGPDGQAKLLHTPKVKRRSKLPPSPGAKKRDYFREGISNPPPAFPEDPAQQMDPTLPSRRGQRTPRITQPTEDTMPRYNTYLEKLLAMAKTRSTPEEDALREEGPRLQAYDEAGGEDEETPPPAPPPKKTTFLQIINKIKPSFPEIKMLFPQPPTYVWNPKGSTPENPKKLDPGQLKAKIKVQIPQLVWTPRSIDGVDTAELDLGERGDRAIFSIGEDANALTVKYLAPGK